MCIFIARRFLCKLWIKEWNNTECVCRAIQIKMAFLWGFKIQAILYRFAFITCAFDILITTIFLINFQAPVTHNIVFRALPILCQYMLCSVWKFSYGRNIFGKYCYKWILIKWKYRNVRRFCCGWKSFRKIRIVKFGFKFPRVYSNTSLNIEGFLWLVGAVQTQRKSTIIIN